MKFLLEIIQAQSVDPSALIALTTDSREIGLKDEKATIHEFTDTLERITHELRSDPNATAFLSRVRKTDAPDYYDVIKKPMDLGTVLKKVKAGVYKTKTAFNEDLELIWTNCFTYNLDMNHHLRAAAESLRNKAQNLLKFVSEPTINSPLPNGTSKPPNRTTTVVQNSASCSQTQSVPLLGLKLAEERWRKTERGRAAFVEEEPPIEDPAHLSTSPNFASLPSNVVDPGPSTSRKVQPEVRLDERKALVRDPDRMWNWFQDAEENKPFEILEADLLMTALPALPFCPRSTTATTTTTTSSKKPSPRDSRKKITKSHPHPPQSPEGLKKSISCNIRTLWDLKKVYRKFSNLIGNQPLRSTEMGTEQVLEDDERVKPIGSDQGNKTDEEEEQEAQPINFMKKLPPSEIYDTSLANSAAHQAMVHIVAMMVTHVGFDAAHVGALHCLTEIAVQYLSNIGRTLHFFVDRFSPILSTSEMIYQTLRANGVGGLEELDRYVKDDVDKYGNKLNDLLRKLQTGYTNVLAGSAAKAIDDEDFFARDGEALMTGEFTNELGEDFFGLRDLGLDSELGLSALRIPSRLFHGRPKTDDTDQTTNEKNENQSKQEARFVRPEGFIGLKTEWIDEQIGLLQPIYRARLETKEFKLKDDDQVARLPKIIRPKVPPSGKIPVKRRPIPSNNNNSSSSNKKVKLGG